jgi:TetR/AcrR family transcriptional regulator, transcriptional repressor for nem operon
MARTKKFNQEAVLDKAVQLFWEKGYNATSANDLVNELGLSRSSLYDTYGDKRKLFILSLNRYRNEIVEKTIKMIDDSTDIRVTIKDIFTLVIEQDIHSKIPKGCFMVNSTVELAPHNSEIAEIVNANMQDIEDALFRVIKKGQDIGEFSKSHTARSLARFVFNAISGLRVASKSGVDKKVLNDIVKVTLSALT